LKENLIQGKEKQYIPLGMDMKAKVGLDLPMVKNYGDIILINIESPGLERQTIPASMLFQK
jgi:hypothetical protein